MNNILTPNYGLVPIRNFGVVNVPAKIYRSAQPYYDYEYAWLKNTLGLETIISLRTELNHDIKSGLAAKYDINTVLTFEVKDHFPPTKKQADDFIQLVKGLAGSPLLFHCEYGHGRTSTFSCLAKMALGMTVDQAVVDEKERFHYEFRHPAQEEWLRSYALLTNS